MLLLFDLIVHQHQQKKKGARNAAIFANADAIPTNRMVFYFVRTGCISKSTGNITPVVFINSSKTGRTSWCLSLNVYIFFNYTVSGGTWGHQKRRHKFIYINDNQCCDNPCGYRHNYGSAQIAKIFQ